MLRFNLHLHGSWDEENDGKRFRGSFKALGEKWWQQLHDENEELWYRKGGENWRTLKRSVWPRFTSKTPQKEIITSTTQNDSAFLGHNLVGDQTNQKRCTASKNKHHHHHHDDDDNKNKNKKNKQQTTNTHLYILQSVKRPTLPLHFQVFPEHNTLLQTLTIWPSALGSSDAIPPGLGHFMRKLVEIVWNSAILEVNSSRCSGFGINNEWHAKTW